MKTTLTLLILLTVFSLNTSAQYLSSIVLEGHTDRVSSVAFSPDETTLASGSEDDTIRLWNVNTGNLLYTLEGHRGNVWSVAFSPDGTTLASRSGDDTIRLWDVNTGNLLHTLEGHRGRVFSVAFNPDGTTLVSGGEPNSPIKLWEVSTGGLLHTLEGHWGNVSSVAFSPDGTTLASGSSDNTIRLWDVNTATELKKFTGHMRGVDSVAFSPDGTTLASRGKNRWYHNTLKLWDVNTGNLLHTLEQNLVQIYFRPDGTILASGRAGAVNNPIKLWDVNTGNPLHTLEGHTDEVNSLAFSPDGTTLAGRSNATIKLWDVNTGNLLNALRGDRFSSWGIAFSPDGTTLTSRSHSNTIRLWELPDTHVSITAVPVDALAIGAQLILNINITEGENVTGYEAVVHFDETALRYVESVNDNYLPDDSFFVSPAVEGNLVTLGATSLAESSSGDGTLATLKFEFIAVKESTVTLSKTRLVNSAGEHLSHRFGNSQTVVGIPRLREDVNLDGVVDILDLTLVAASFGKGSPRVYPVDLDVDVNKDGIVDIKDLIEINILNVSFNPWSSNPILDPADVNEDGIIDIVDLVLVAGALGNVAAGPSAYPQALAMLTVGDVQKWLSQVQQLNLTDPAAQRGILFLQQLLAALIPKETALLPNYPNPFNPETWIPYQLAESADVTLTIYAVDGTAVRTLALGHQSVGIYKGKSRAAYWDGRNELGESVASGLYFYTLTAGDFTGTQKMLIRK